MSSHLGKVLKTLVILNNSKEKEKQGFQVNEKEKKKSQTVSKWPISIYNGIQVYISHVGSLHFVHGNQE